MESNRRQIYEKRRLPKILSFDSLNDEYSQSAKRTKLDENYNRIENHPIEFETRSRKVSQVAHSTSYEDEGLSPITESDDVEEECDNSNNLAKINELVSRDKLRSERKLFRDSVRNQKRLRKTTLVEGIKELIDIRVDIDEDDMMRYKKITFTNDAKAPIKLRSGPKKKRLKKSKSFDEVFIHENYENHEISSPPPPPPEGSPPKHCPQPKLKESINVYEYLPQSMIQSCILSLENLGFST